MHDTVAKVARLVRDRIEDVHGGLMGGLCGIASAALKLSLEKVGVEAELVYGNFGVEEHCWLEFGEMFVDITIDQFGDYPEILIETKSSKTFQTFYKKSTEETPSTDGGDVFWRNWPREQRPLPGVLARLII